MKGSQAETQNQPEAYATLSELEAEVRLPDERPRRNHRKKSLLALIALLLLAAVAVIGGYYLLRGKQVDVRATKRLPEKVTSGKDIKQAAFDSISGSLSETARTPQPVSNPEPAAIAPTNDKTERVPAPTQPGIATTLAPPPEVLLPTDASPDAARQPTNALSAKRNSASPIQTANAAATKPSATLSVRFAPVMTKSVVPSGASEVSAKNDFTPSSGKTEQSSSSSRASETATAPNFGAMLPVRLMGVFYNLRQGALARLELTRDLRAGDWQLRRGTIFIGQALGGDLDRAYLQIKGFIDPDTQRFTQIEGEVLGNDGGAGLRGKRRRVSPAWARVLDRTAEAGVQIATGVLNRRSSSVIVATDPYGTYRSASGADSLRSEQNRAFVEVAAGTAGFVLVTTIPAAASGDKLAQARAQNETLTDEELAELMAAADPARIRAALPKMTPELQRVAQMLLKEIEAEKP